MKYFLTIIIFVFCTSLIGQVESYDEMNVEADSTIRTYKPAGKNYVFIRSKRGNSGVNKSSRADSIIAFPVTEIVLVYTETDPSQLASREEANRERWENLLLTYPEYFQENTTYKALCQCSANGDEAAFKQALGFYVYFTGEEPKMAEKTPEVVAAPVKAEPVKTKSEEKIEEKKSVAKEDKKAAKKEKETEKPEVKEIVNEPVKETVKETRQPENVAVEDDENTPVVNPVKPKERAKKPVTTKPRKARDPKACRLPCYENGDEDLNAFFMQNITLSKKQKRKGKNLLSVLRLQLNNDGSIKKAMVTGENEAFNLQVQEAAKMMNQWNPAVKNGITVKSEVKITLKFDRETKSIKPFEVAIIPRLGPKCQCVSDAEIFGSAD
jgi:hypothetical protein